jgi:hypothetical protein
MFQSLRRMHLATLIALISAMLLLGGMCISKSPAVTATPMGTMIDATRHVRDSTQTLPDIMFGVAAAVAGIFIVVYIAGIGTKGPRRGRYKAD